MNLRLTPRQFVFRIGAGEVIKGTYTGTHEDAPPEPTFRPGWDVGVLGMKAGGERELTIPAPMGYGKRKTSGIPPNSTLKFGQFLLRFLLTNVVLTHLPIPEVKLLSIQ